MLCCRKNKNITLEEFKFIWWMEYAHRQWGRLIGAAFFIPATIFWSKGWFKPVLKKRIIAFGTLIAMQVFQWNLKFGLGNRGFLLSIALCEPRQSSHVIALLVQSSLAKNYLIYWLLIVLWYLCLSYIGSGILNM